MKEDVTYLIDAEDKATAKVQNAKAEVKKMVGEVRDLGGKSKASAELVGTLAAQIGSTGAGQAAGEIGQLIERVSAFSEVAKSGGKGALFLKAGIVAAAGVIAFKLGNAIGNVIFKTERWKKVSQEAIAEITAGASRVTSGIDRAFKSQLDFANAITETDARDSKLDEVFKRAAVEADGAAANVRGLQKQIQQMESDSSLGFQSENHKAEIEAAKARLEVQKQTLETRRGHVQAMRDMLSPAAKALKIAQEEFAANQKSAGHIESLQSQLQLAKATGDERLKIELQQAGVLADQIDAAIGLRKELDAARDVEQQRIAAEQEKQRAIDETEAKRKAAAEAMVRDEERRADFQAKAVENLKLQVVEMTKGKEAADALRLAQGGFEKDKAADFARLKNEIEKLNSLKSQSATPSQSNTTTDDRLLTGRSSSAFENTAEQSEAKRQTKIQNDLLKVMENLLEFERSKPELSIIQHGS